MFSSSHHCNLSKLPHESEASRGCGVKSLCSAAQFSSVSESIRARGSFSSSVKWKDVPSGSHRCVFSCVEVISLSLWSADRGRPLQKPFNACRRPSGTVALTDLSIWQTYQSSLAERCTRECQENEEEDDEEVLLPNKSFCFTAFILWHVVRVGGLALNNGDN